MSEIAKLNDDEAGLLGHYTWGKYLIFDAVSVLTKVFALSDRGLLEAAPPGMPGYRLTKAGQLALNNWKSHECSCHRERASSHKQCCGHPFGIDPDCPRHGDGAEQPNA